MDRTEFKKRMQSLKSYREQNPDKGYWDWKVEQFQDGGDNSDDRTDHPIYRPDVPLRIERSINGVKWSDLTWQERFLNSKGKINGRPTEQGLIDVYPEFDILTGLRGITSKYKHIIPTTGVSKEAQKVFQNQIIPRRISKLSEDFNETLNSSNNKENLISLIKQFQKEGVQIDFDRPDAMQQLQNLFNRVTSDDLTVKDATSLVNFFETQDIIKKLRNFANDPNNFRYRNKPILFNKDKNITGTYDPSTDTVEKLSTAGDETLIHEFRHRLDNKVPLTRKEEDILYNFYDKAIHPGEQVTTNSELRHNILKQFNRSDIDVIQQDKFLQSLTSDELYDALTQVNGYGSTYAQNFNRKKLLDALIKVGAIATPVSIYSNNYKDGGEIPPDNSPVHVNPFTKKPLANGAITPVLDLEGAANFTPAGDVLSIRDAYVAAKNNDLLGLGLAGLGFLPFVPRIGRSKVSKVNRPPIPEVHPNYFQEQMEKAEKAAAKRKQAVNDFYTQQDQTYESLIENEDAFRRAVNADASTGTNYTGVYGDYLKNYSRSSSRYNDNLTSIRLTDDIPSEAKAQVDPRNLNWIRVNSRYADPDELDPVFQQMNPGLVRHELGHVTDEKAGLDYVNKLGDRSKFESESKLKEMFPKTYKRVQDYLLRGSEIKSHMNEFRDYLYSIGQYSSTETAKSLRQKLDKYGSNFKNLKILFDAYKNKRQFARDYNTIPLIGTSALGINYYLNQEEQRRD